MWMQIQLQEEKIYQKLNLSSSWIYLFASSRLIYYSNRYKSKDQN